MIGLDFNDKFVKVVELKDTPQGLTLTRFNISPVTIEQGQDAAAAISKTIYQAFSESGILETEVYTVISGSMVQVRRLTLPPMPEGELRDAVKWEAHNFATFPVENALIDYNIIEKGPQGSQKIDLLVAAIEAATFKKHLSAISSAGLRCAGITIAPFALGQLLRRVPSLSQDELVAIVDFAAEEVSINLFKNYVPQFTRQVKIGESLEREILSSFTYYREQFLEEKVGRLYLSGESSQLEEIKASLSASLGITIEILDPLKNINIDPKVDPTKLQEMSPRLTLAIGLAENKARQMNLLGKKEKAPRTNLEKILKSISIPNAAVIGTLVFIVALVFGANFYLSRSVEETKQELNVKSLKLSQLGKFQERKLAYEGIQRKRVDVKNMLGQLAGLLPEGVSLVSLSYEQQTNSVSLLGETNSPQAVSRLVKKLDESASFSAVQLKEIKKIGKVITFYLAFQVD